MGNNSQTTKQTYEPFTGEMKTKYNNLLSDAENRYNNNSNANGLSQFAGKTADTSAWQDAYDYTKNLASNSTLASMAGGQYLDPTKDANFMKSLGYATDAITKSGGKSYDNINTIMQTKGFGPTSSMWQTAQANNAKNTQDSIGQTTSNALVSQYNTNVNNMLNANNTLGNFSQYLEKMGLDQNNMSDNELNRALNLYKTKVGLDEQAFNDLQSTVKMGSNPTTTTNTETESDPWGSIAGLGMSMYAKKNKWW